MASKGESRIPARRQVFSTATMFRKPQHQTVSSPAPSHRSFINQLITMPRQIFRLTTPQRRAEYDTRMTRDSDKYKWQVRSTSQLRD